MRDVNLNDYQETPQTGSSVLSPLRNNRVNKSLHFEDARNSKLHLFDNRVKFLEKNLTDKSQNPCRSKQINA